MIPQWRKSVGGAVLMLILALAVWIVMQGCGGCNGEVEPPDVEPPKQDTCNVDIRWDSNSEDDLAGYNLYWGTISRQYTFKENVGLDTTHRIENLTDGVWYFAVTAFDSSGNESDFSEEVSIELDSCITDSLPDPEPPECDIPFGETRVAELAYDNFEPEREHLRLAKPHQLGSIEGVLCQEGIYHIDLKVKNDIDSSDKFTVFVGGRTVGTIMTNTTNNDWEVYEIGTMKVAEGETLSIMSERGGPGSFCRIWKVVLR